MAAYAALLVIVGEFYRRELHSSGDARRRADRAGLEREMAAARLQVLAGADRAALPLQYPG